MQPLVFRWYVVSTPILGSAMPDNYSYCVHFYKIHEVLTLVMTDGSEKLAKCAF